MYTSLYRFVCKTMPQITTHGRVKVGTDGGLRLSWSASGLTFTFKGEAFAVELMPYVTSVLPIPNRDQLYATLRVDVDGAYRSLVTDLSVTDPKVHYTHVKPIDASLGEVGRNGHPSAAGQKRIGKDLTQALKGLGFGASVPAR